MKRLLVGIAIILGAATICGAQPAAYLAIDVLPGAQASNPNQPAVIGDTMYFAAGTPALGRELYKYSGTGPATIISDINPGAASGLEIGSGIEVPVINGKFVFMATAPGTGRELWEYSPATGPKLVMDIYPGGSNSTPLYMRAINGKVYFGATSGFYNRLFIYDGVNPPATPPGGIAEGARSFTEYRGKIYMAAHWGNVGDELCAYDPATNSCSLVKDIKAISDGSPSGLLAYGSKLYFSAASDSNGAELHSYNGDSVKRLTDINPGLYNGILSSPIAYKGKLYFAGTTTPNQSTSQLYAFDTLTQTASMFMDIFPGGDALPQYFFIYRDTLYFSAKDASRGRELWMYDGVNMPAPITDISPGAGSSFPADLTVFQNTLYFTATSPSSGYEWYALKNSTPAPTAVLLTPERLQCTAAPNPAQHALTISWALARPASIGFRLADAGGRTVWSGAAQRFAAGTGRTEIPMGELQPGLYFYQLIGEDGRVLANGRVVKR